MDQLFKVAVILEIPVIGYGLRTDFLLHGFEGSETYPKNKSIFRTWRDGQKFQWERTGSVSSVSYIEE